MSANYLLRVQRFAENAIARDGDNATIIVHMRGRWGQSDIRRLFRKAGPKGEIIADDNGVLTVKFDAKAVKIWCEGVACLL